MTDNNTPLRNSTALPKIGGFRGLRIAYSRDIVQQELQTKTELSAIIFQYAEKWVGAWQYSDEFTGELKIDSSVSEHGFSQVFSVKAVIEIDADPEVFGKWYDEKIKGQRFAVELTNNNDYVRAFNQMILLYSYVGVGIFDGINRYELTFQKVQFYEYPVSAYKVIKDVTARRIIYTTGSNNQVTINLLTGRDPALLEFGYGITDDINAANFQVFPERNILENVPDGVYYFFARNTQTARYDVVEAAINTVIPEPIINNPFFEGDLNANEITGEIDG